MQINLATPPRIAQAGKSLLGWVEYNPPYSLIALLPSPQAIVPPILHPPDEMGAQGVSLDVAANRQQVVISLDGERLESPLIQMTEQGGAVLRGKGFPKALVRDP